LDSCGISQEFSKTTIIQDVLKASPPLNAQHLYIEEFNSTSYVPNTQPILEENETKNLQEPKIKVIL